MVKKQEDKDLLDVSAIIEKVEEKPIVVKEETKRTG
jgi:hypothetical protein